MDQNEKLDEFVYLTDDSTDTPVSAYSDSGSSWLSLYESVRPALVEVWYDILTILSEDTSPWLTW